MNPHMIKKPGKLWLIVLPALCVIYFIFNFYRATFVLPSLPWLLGTHAFTAAVVWAVFYFLFLRRHRHRIALIAYLALFFSLCSGTVGGHWYVRHVIDIATDEIIAAATATVQTTNEAQLKALEPLLAIENTQSHGATADVVNLNKKLLRQLAISQVSYQQQVNSAVLEAALHPSTITSQIELVNAIETLERLQLAADEYMQTITHLNQELSVEILTLGISHARYRSLVELFSKNFKRLLSNYQSVIEGDLAAYHALLAATQLLESRYGHWQAEGNEIRFDDPEETYRYYRLTERIDSLLE